MTTRYTPHTADEVARMLEEIGVASVEDLFADILPEYRPQSFRLEPGRSEYEVRRICRGLSDHNCSSVISFLGGGFYDHHIPSVVDALSSRAEFYTAYTPYQPECSQGTLQAIYEYQSAVCALTGMEIANASLYDGGTSLYEAVMIAVRTTGRKKIVIDGAVTPVYRALIRAYTRNLGLTVSEIPPRHLLSDDDALARSIDSECAAVVVQNPNFFGTVHDYTALAARAHDRGSRVIVSAYPMSLGILKTPRDMGADIVTGEGQSLGMPLSFGGPYLGIIAATKELARRMPGRIVGATHDAEGRKGFVLTLQAREQHIRREKATSNICSNQALCALRAVIFLSALGKEGFRECARANRDIADYAKRRLGEIDGVSVDMNVPTFNEFVVKFSKDAAAVRDALIAKNLVAGLPLGPFYKDMDSALLIAVTEKRTTEEVDHFARSLKDVVCHD